MDGTIVDATLDPNFRNPRPRPAAEYAMDSRNPEIARLTPSIANEGDSGLTIEMTGHKFTPRSIVRFDTSDLETTFVSESTLSATIGGPLLSRGGTYAVTVINPGPAGGVSETRYLVVRLRK